MPQLRGNGACGFPYGLGIGMDAVAADARDRPGNADSGGNVSALVQNRGGHATRAHVCLLIVDGVALLHGESELLPQTRKVRNGAWSGTFKGQQGQYFLTLFRRKKSEQRFAERRAVDRPRSEERRVGKECED